MELRALGRTGIDVSALCLGTIALGAWGNADGDDAVRLIHRALDAGINLIDTAGVYSGGEAESIVGRALAGARRDSVLVSSKLDGAAGADTNSRRWIVEGVEGSLRRLQTDRIDLCLIDRLPLGADVDEALGALTDLVRAGKIRVLGTARAPVSMLVEAQWVAEQRGSERFACEQAPYSVLARAAERELLPTCARYSVAALACAPLAGGWLAGGYRRGAALPLSTRAARDPRSYDMALVENQRKLRAADVLAALAGEAGLTPVELALAFVLRHPAVTAAVIGPRTIDQLEGHLGAAEVSLSDELLARIDEIVAPGTALDPGA